MVYFGYLSEHFENDVLYYQHTNNVLCSIMELLPASRNKLIMVQNEVRYNDMGEWEKRRVRKGGGLALIVNIEYDV